MARKLLRGWLPWAAVAGLLQRARHRQAPKPAVWLYLQAAIVGIRVHPAIGHARASMLKVEAMGNLMGQRLQWARAAGEAAESLNATEGSAVRQVETAGHRPATTAVLTDRGWQQTRGKLSTCVHQQAAASWPSTAAASPLAVSRNCCRSMLGRQWSRRSPGSPTQRSCRVQPLVGAGTRGAWRAGGREGRGWEAA